MSGIKRRKPRRSEPARPDRRWQPMAVVLLAALILVLVGPLLFFLLGVL
jgi:hypothetical protein